MAPRSPSELPLQSRDSEMGIPDPSPTLKPLTSFVSVKNSILGRGHLEVTWAKIFQFL